MKSNKLGSTHFKAFVTLGCLGNLKGPKYLGRWLRFAGAGEPYIFPMQAGLQFRIASKMKSCAKAITLF